MQLNILPHGGNIEICGSSPAINIPLWTVNSLRLAAIKSYKNYKTYKMTINAGYVKNAQILAQPSSAT